MVVKRKRLVSKMKRKSGKKVGKGGRNREIVKERGKREVGRVQKKLIVKVMKREKMCKSHLVKFEEDNELKKLIP